MLDPRYVKKNYLKDLRSSRLMFCENNDVSFSHLEFLLWAYEKEFWTIAFAASEYGVNKNGLANRFIYPMMRQGLIYKHFDKLTTSGNPEDQMFRDETKFNYRVRYGITQKARLLVQRFYGLFEN